jgi:hypothetical protein
MFSVTAYSLRAAGHARWQANQYLQEAGTGRHVLWVTACCRDVVSQHAEAKLEYHGSLQAHMQI